MTASPLRPERDLGLDDAPFALSLVSHWSFGPTSDRVCALVCVKETEGDRVSSDVWPGGLQGQDDSRDGREMTVEAKFGK